MPSYSRTKGAVVASEGFYVGSTGTETLAISSTGFAQKSPENFIVSFASASTTQDVGSIIPVTGTVIAGYAFAGGATQVGTYTLIHGSAGGTIATITATSGSLGTVTAAVVVTSAASVTAGEYVTVTRGSCAATGVSSAMFNITQTA